MEVYSTHKFLFTLKYENRMKDHEVEFIDRNNNTKRIKIKDIEITSSSISCKLVDANGDKHLIPFIRIRKIFYKDNLVWDNSDSDMSNVRIVKGY